MKHIEMEAVMQLDSVKFGAASAVALALLWLACSLSVILILGGMVEEPH
jgi:hypothetical protein